MDSQMKIQMSNAELVRFCRFPSTRVDKHLIKSERVFSLNCMIPAPTFWRSTANNLMDSYAIAAFLSVQYSEATKLIENNYYLRSWSHTHNCMKMMSILIVLSFSYTQCRLLLFWWGQVGKHIQPFIRWFAGLRRIII